ncbi:MAG: putative quinol monooxygenase [Pleomorphochaeta sp.]
MLTLVANIYAKEDSIEFVKNEILKVIPSVRAEKGCVNYDLHQEINTPNMFVLYENWESREDWNAHMDAKHLKAFQEAIKNYVKETTVYQLNKIK